MLLTPKMETMHENFDSENNVSKFKKRKFKHEEKSDKPAKLPKSELFKAPTTEELNQLRETEVLFNSNLFRLQTEELLKAVSIKPKRKRQFDKWFESFSNFLTTLPEHTTLNLSDFDLCQKSTTKTELEKDLKQIYNNYPLEIKTDLDSTVKLLKPLGVQIVGLYNVNATINSTLKIVLNVTMPKICFNEKDYLNCRYLIKKSLYLSYITSYLNESELSLKTVYTVLNGNIMSPILQVTPNGVNKCIIEIVLTPEENTFNLSRLNPYRRNIKMSFICAHFNDNIKVVNPISTGIYNSAIANDATLNINDNFCKNILKDMKGACDGLILMSIWLRQRELYDGYGSFNDSLMYSLVAYLAHVNKINKHMSSYQVIRNVWNHLSQSSWDVEGPSMSTTPNINALFHVHFDVVFVDITGHNNLAANLDLSVYQKVKYEAGLAMFYLDEGKFNSFQALFMTKMPFYLQYDAVINIFNDTVFDDIYASLENEIKIKCFTLWKYPLVKKHILKTLKIGLSNRITHIVTKLVPNSVWDVGTKPEIENQISFGLNLDFANMFKVIDKGPPAYDPLTNQFRKFWGDKAELRRFKDGTICEAVYWPAIYVCDKRRISKQIIEYVLENNFHIKNFNIVYDQLEPVIQLYKQPTMEEGNVKVINTFDELAKILRDLNLPLSISAIQGISDIFCYTDPYPPAPANSIRDYKNTIETETNILFKSNLVLEDAPKYVPSISGIIQMVQHSKWPNDLEALNKLRTAFYIQIAEKLPNMKCNPKQDVLDIMYKGLVFRFVLFHPKQIALMKKVDDKGVISYRDNACSIQAEQKFEIEPKIISALSGIHSQYPSYGPSTALAKRWLSSQLIDVAHMPNIIINLLCASLYLNNAPFTVSVLPQTTFLRFLTLLANHDWQLQTIVVNFNNEITKETVDETDSYFQGKREDFPPLCIITPYDIKSSLSLRAPSTQMLHRLSVLAKECLDIIESTFYTQTLFNAMSFFKSNLAGYNLIIHIQPLLNSRKHEYVFRDDDNKDSQLIFEENKNDRIPIVDFNPVALYVNELRMNYDKFALFFYDHYGGNVIAVLWKPEVYQKEDFKIGLTEGKKLVEKDKLVVNLDAIIEDFYILGDGLVKNIDKL